MKKLSTIRFDSSKQHYNANKQIKNPTYTQTITLLCKLSLPVTVHYQDNIENKLIKRGPLLAIHFQISYVISS